MGFEVSGDAYDRFMGRYSRSLSPQFAEFAGVEPAWRVLDVGSGPGALTAELVDRVGAASVVAVDPSEAFVAALAERLPAVETARAGAEALPFEDGAFDAALAQLVVHFMSDPVGGIREMGRVTRPGGVVAACTWDLAGGRNPLAILWRAARELQPDVRGEADRPGTHQGMLEALFGDAGLAAIEGTELEVPFDTPFEEWWEPFKLGVGPAGEYVAGLDENARERLHERCRELFPSALPAVAWAARGRA